MVRGTDETFPNGGFGSTPPRTAQRLNEHKLQGFFLIKNNLLKTLFHWEGGIFQNALYP